MEEVSDYCLDGFGEFLTSLHSGTRWETISLARKKEVEVSARWWWCQFVRFQLFVTVLCIERGNTFVGCLGIVE